MLVEFGANAIRIEGNARGRRATSISLQSSIAGSVTEGNDSYSLHGTGVGMCLNEQEDVAFTSSRNLRGAFLERGPCTAMTNLSSHGPASLQAQRFGIEITFVA